MLQLQVIANIVPRLPILSTMMMEVICSSKMLVLTRATWHHVSEDGILHSHCCENFRSYMICLLFLCPNLKLHSGDDKATYA
jgi:hypothetical protein